MKKSFKLENLDCANCAAKMENAINKLPNVNAAISFMSQRLTIEFNGENLDEALDTVQKTIKKIEPDCIIVR